MKIPLYGYQKRAVRKIRSIGGRGALFMEMGTGKTRTALAIIDDAAIPRHIVVCPTTAVSVWQDEVEKLKLPYKILDLTEGPIRTRAMRLRRFSRYDGPFLVLINTEAYWREPLRTAIRKFLPGAFIIDEAQRIKNRGARQSRFAHIIGDRDDIQYVLSLTGTPISKGLQDIYSIFRFTNPEIFGHTWAQFKDRYLVFGGYFNHQIVDYIHVKEAERLIAENSFQQAKRDAHDLPPVSSVMVRVRMKKKNRKLYQQFAKESIAEISGYGEDGRPRSGVALASIVLTLKMRLQQLTSGFLRTEDGDLIDIGDEKLKACLELVELARENGEKVVIFCRFTRDVRRLAERLPEASIIRGGMKRAARDRARKRLMAGHTDVLISEIRTGSLGIDLTAASIGIFYSANHDLVDYSQAKDRLDRPGQTRPITFYHLIAGPVDLEVFENLENKRDVARLVTKLDYAKKILTSDFSRIDKLKSSL